MLLDPKDPLALAATSAIHSGDTTSLTALLQAHPSLATAYIGTSVSTSKSTSSEQPGARTLLHILIDYPGNFIHGPTTATILLSHGADPNAPFLGPQHAETSLHWAASCDNVAVLDVLLDGGADVDAGGGVIAGGTALADARAFGQWKVAKRLVERGAKVTLMDCAALGMLEEVRAWYECEGEGVRKGVGEGVGAGIKRNGRCRPSSEETSLAFWNACHGAQLEVAEYLHSQGADVNREPPWEALTPLGAARKSEVADVVDWLEGLNAK